uniref:Uncharacterized protein n=1 Tax=Grammatophora oceanica TaxID=210454 RepID=A0A7S1ULZ4_9STRA
MKSTAKFRRRRRMTGRGPYALPRGVQLLCPLLPATLASSSTTLYESSELETLWLNNIQEWTKQKSICEQIMGQESYLEEFMASLVWAALMWILHLQQQEQQ